MTFTVEDGTGKEDANSYSDIEFADAYFLERGVSSWDALENSEKEILLIKATDYIDIKYGTSFYGNKEFPDVQALEFPRVEFTDIPVKLKKATCEYALLLNTTALVVNPTIDDAGLQVKSSTEKVGPLETKIDYFQTQTVYKKFPMIDGLLNDFITHSNLLVRW